MGNVFEGDWELLEGFWRAPKTSGGKEGEGDVHSCKGSRATVTVQNWGGEREPWRGGVPGREVDWRHRNDTVLEVPDVMSTLQLHDGGVFQEGVYKGEGSKDCIELHVSLTFAGTQK